MNAEQVFARSAIEALRSGVPSRHAVEQLGTTQNQIKDTFEARLKMMDTGQGVEPLVIAANFGAGKSHLLNYLRSLAANQGCVTSFVVVSPETALGNPHIVLKALAEAAEAPGRTGRALRALASDMHTNTPEFAQLRVWARDSGLDGRFPAMLHLYEELRADEEFRTQILSDFEGCPLVITLLRQRLKELGQEAGYALKGTKNALLAHDRIRLLAQLYRACGASGWVILFDELDRFTVFPTKQRLAAWEELGWWKAAAEGSGASILPVFAILSGAVDQKLDEDEPRFRSSALGYSSEDRDLRGLAGIEMIKKPVRLTTPDAEQEDLIKYRVKSIYEEAYGVQTIPIDAARLDVTTTIRSEIRRWITQWDLLRCYPDHSPNLVNEEMVFDKSETVDESVIADDDSDTSA